MNYESSKIHVCTWAAVRATTPAAIFARLDERVARTFDDEEAAALSRSFAILCDTDGQISESQFIAFVVSKGRLSPDLAKAVRILFDSLCQVPLGTDHCPAADSIDAEWLAARLDVDYS